jgi:cell division protein FtsB
MTAARLGYRTNQRETIEKLSREVNALKAENERLKRQIAELSS